jgi:hypothetical protein
MYAVKLLVQFFCDFKDVFKTKLKNRSHVPKHHFESKSRKYKHEIIEVHILFQEM